MRVGSVSSRPRLPIARAVLAATLVLAIAGCSRMREETTGAIAPGAESRMGESEWRGRVDALAARYKAEPGNPRVAIDYARALRATGQRDQAAAVLQQASIRSPKNRDVLGAYGRALADSGQFPQALDVLSRAHTPDQPDWRIYNAQGAVLDQMGKHADAQAVYRQALAIAPEEPAILSNLGLSHALSKDLRQAETVLRRAAARPGADTRVRQNLALVMGLQGRFDEAERVATADLPAGEAQANLAYLREMMSQADSWKSLGGGQPPARSPARTAQAGQAG